MSILERLRRRADTEPETPADLDDASDPANAGRLPDWSRPPQRRGTWEQAALVNTAITERIKRQLGTVTPPWKK